LVIHGFHANFKFRYRYFDRPSPSEAEAAPHSTLLHGKRFLQKFGKIRFAF
jgi:hypothetical protein